MLIRYNVIKYSISHQYNKLIARSYAAITLHYVDIYVTYHQYLNMVQTKIITTFILNKVEASINNNITKYLNYE